MPSTTRARRVLEQKSRHFLKTARVPIAVLTFPYSREKDVSNVARLREAFRLGQCEPHNRDYCISAIISPDDYNEDLFRDSEGQAYPIFTPPETVRLHCLRGRHRVAAAEGLFYGEQTWLVDIYHAGDISKEAKEDLIDKYDSEKPPGDGEFYYNIQLYSGSFGWEKSNAALEARWWTRWRSLPRKSRDNDGGDNDIEDKKDADPLKRLLGKKKWVAAFDKFQHIKAIYSGLWIPSTGRMISLGHQVEELLSMVHLITQFWRHVFENNPTAMRNFDRHSLSALQGRAPGASEKERTSLEGQVASGKILGAFEPVERQRYFGNLCNATTVALAPSLTAIFGNLQYLVLLKDCLGRLVAPSDGQSLRSVLEQHFHVNEVDANKGVYKIQVDELNLKLFCTKDDPFELAYRQLWLFVFRNFVSMPRIQDPKKAGPRGDPADRQVLYRFALLAFGLGFRSHEIDQLRKHDPDVLAGKDALEKSRSPSQYLFPDMERSARLVADQMRTAVPIERDPDDAVREPQRKGLPRRWGIPHDHDYRRDRVRLFLPDMHSELPHQKGQLSSLFIARSLYFCLLGYELRTDFTSAVSAAIPLHPSASTSSSLQGVTEAHSNAKKTELGANVSELETIIVNLRLEKETLENDIHPMREEKSDLCSVIKSLGEEKSKLEGELSEHSTKKIDLDADIETLEVRKRELGNEIFEQSKITGSLNDGIKVLEANKQALETELAHLNGEKEKLVEGVNYLRTYMNQISGEEVKQAPATVEHPHIHDPKLNVEAETRSDLAMDSGDENDSDNDEQIRSEHDNQTRSFWARDDERKFRREEQRLKETTRSTEGEKRVWLLEVSEDGKLKVTGMAKGPEETEEAAEVAKKGGHDIYCFNAKNTAGRVADPEAAYRQAVRYDKDMLVVVKGQNTAPTFEDAAQVRKRPMVYEHGDIMPDFRDKYLNRESKRVFGNAGVLNRIRAGTMDPLQELLENVHTGEKPVFVGGNDQEERTQKQKRLSLERKKQKQVDELFLSNKQIP